MGWSWQECTNLLRNFLQLQVHEIGHALGLAHSSVYDSIMFPYYQGKSDGFALGYDDILAMYQLYSKFTIHTKSSFINRKPPYEVHLVRCIAAIEFPFIYYTTQLIVKNPVLCF